MIDIRIAGEADTNFILSSWTRAYAGLNREQPKWAVLKLQTQIIKGAMEMGSVWVATPEGDDDTIAGWICHVGPVAQFMYVKKPFRGFGVGKKLIEKAGLREPVMAAYMAPWMTDRVIYSPQLQHADVLKAFMEDT